jgi:hypothetical protein
MQVGRETLVTFAKGTSVSVEKSRMDIDSLLSKHGAGQRGVLCDDEGGVARLLFTMAGRQIRLEVPLPRPSEFAKRAKGERNYWRSLTPAEQRSRWEQACRERWRLVLLFLRAKLENIALGVSTVEREFLADVTLANGQTVYQALQGAIAESYETGRMPRQLGPAASSDIVDAEIVDGGSR